MGHGVKGMLRAATAVLLLVSLPSCDFVGPTAPLQSAIDISANPLAIGLNGEASTVTVIVSDAESNPPPDGTLVFLTTTLGTIAAQVELSNGRATADLVSGAQGGVARVTAASGNNVVATVDITIGSSLAQLALTASPSTLPSAGGESEIRAIALDENGEPLAGIPVIFTTTAGSLASGGSVVRTDGDGEATDRLTTAAPATVTASSGSITGTAAIVLAASNQPPIASFTVSPAAPAVGQRVSFNAAPSADGDGAIVSYEWDFGDGDSGTGREASHAYGVPGSYVVVLTVTDDAGTTASASSNVTVTAQ